MRKVPIIFGLLLLSGALILPAQAGLSARFNADADAPQPQDRIAVAADGESEDSGISQVAGRAPYYLIFDAKGIFLKAVRNPASRAGSRASLQVVNLLVRESCKAVIAGNFGRNMEYELRAKGIEFFKRQGTAKEAVQSIVEK